MKQLNEYRARPRIGKALVIAAALLCATALSQPNPAYAGGFHGGGFHGGGFRGRGFGYGLGAFGLGYGLYGPYGYDYYPYYGYGYEGYADDGGCYIARQRIHTKKGWRIRRIEICE